MLKVTSHGHHHRCCGEWSERRGQKHQTRTNINCRESIFSRTFFCLLSMAVEGEHIITLWGTPVSRWCNKISQIKEWKNISAVAIFARTLHDSVNYFFRSFETNGVSTPQKSVRKWDIHGNCHPALFALSFVLLVSRKNKSTEWGERDMQRNHAGSNSRINYVWLRGCAPRIRLDRSVEALSIDLSDEHNTSNQPSKPTSLFAGHSQ